MYCKNLEMENLSELEYHETSYFNENDEYLFLTNYNKAFVSKVHFYNGACFTNELLKYKVTSIKSIKIDRSNKEHMKFLVS